MTRLGARPLPGPASALLSVVAITVAVAVSYHRVIFEGLVLSGYDAQTYFFPIRSYASRVLLSGEAPLWNPYLFMGAPFLANPQTAVFYPLNLVLMPLDAARAVSLSVVIHVWLAAVGALVFARRVLNLRWVPSTAAALAFGLGGLLSGQTGHPNQLAVIAWLPFALWMVWLISTCRAGWPALGLALVVSLQILAGHPQQLYMSTAFCAAFLVFALLFGRRDGASWNWRDLGLRGGLFLSALALGAALAAVQILPSLLLSSLSIRSGGLALYEAGSFSLTPAALGPALLPSFIYAPSSQEFLAFAGFTATWLAALAFIAPVRRRFAFFFAALALLCIVLSVGPATPVFRAAHAVVPGFDLFRVPARWLLGLNISLAFLAGIGLDYLLALSSGWSRRTLTALALALLAVCAAAAISVIANGNIPDAVPQVWAVAAVLSLGVLALVLIRPRRWAVLIPLAVAAELIAAQRPLELARPIPVEAYSNPGSVVSLLPEGPGAPRVLGLADPSYEVNDADRALLASRHQEALGYPTFLEFLVSLKYRDTLSPNLPLAYLRSSPDGYDGGVLPTRDFILLKDALVPGAALAPDAILRNQVEGVPDRKMLDLLGAGYLIVDRKDDIEVDGVFFDTEIELSVEADGARTVLFASEIGVGEVAVLGEVTIEEGGIPPDTSGWLEVLRGERVLTSMPVSPGAEIANGKFAVEIGSSIATDLTASTYVSKRGLDSPELADRIRIRSAPGVRLTVRAITLTDDRGLAIPLPLNTVDPLELLHWTDAKIYKNPNPLPRVFLVNSFALADDPGAAAAALRSDDFDPREVALLEKSYAGMSPSRPFFGWFGDRLRDAGLRGARARIGTLGPDDAASLTDRAVAPGAASLEIPTLDLGAGNTDAEVRVRSYEHGRVDVAVKTAESAILVVGDAIYPGWRARIDGVEVPLMRANMLFKAVLVPAGAHEVVFSYEPGAFSLGAVISIASLTALLAAAIVLGLKGRRKMRQA